MLTSAEMNAAYHMDTYTHSNNGGTDVMPPKMSVQLALSA